MDPNFSLGVRAAKTLRAVSADPGRTLLALDFDGTLSPIVDDPSAAYIHPEALDAMDRLGELLGKVAVITGRGVETVRELGGFEQRTGLTTMSVLGQYGVERWDAATGKMVVPPIPDAVLEVEHSLPRLLDDLGLADVHVEEKGRAVVLHTRGLPDPAAALDRLREPIGALAESHDLILEPGKNVLEIRAPGTDKGDAVRALVSETGARQVIFAGDDLGDLPAFDAVDALRDEGVQGLLVCSSSDEQSALVERADVVLEGPGGIAAALTWLADRLTS